MLSEPETIIDEEIGALWEPPPASPIGRGRRQRRRQRRRAVVRLLHPERRMERILIGSLVEQLKGTPTTGILRASIAKKIIDLFWTALPEEDDRWLRATHIAHSIAEAVMQELSPLQTEEAEPPSPEDENFFSSRD